MIQKKSKFFIIVAGPTGVGKTDFVLNFAQQIPSEIVNIDVGQFYTQFSIGTAKPNWKKEPILHHLFDIIDSPKNFTVIEYRKIVIKKMEEIWMKNKLPILVGGSGFYIQSLFFPPSSKTESNNEIELLSENLWEKLYEIDPERAKKIDKNDNYRIKRALNIWLSTKTKPSSYVPIYDPPGNFLLLIFNRNRDDLYKRIDHRVIEMIQDGWIDEVKKIKNSNWEGFLKQKKLIGYDDILNYLESYYNNDQDLLIETIQKKTRNYAKRQITFFKMLTKKIDSNKKNKAIINWYNLSTTSIKDIISELLKNINYN